MLTKRGMNSLSQSLTTTVALVITLDRASFEGFLSLCMCVYTAL